jgi:hypothetical protein
MTQSVQIQELAIVVSVKNNNPTVLNSDFLKYSGVVPANWELARSPLYTKEAAQLLFQNGINLISQTDRVAFIEEISEKSIELLETPQIATKYLKTLPNAEYQALGINLKGYIPFDKTDAAHNYLSSQVLANGPWQGFGDRPVQAAVNLAYSLEEGRLQMSIGEATLQLPQKDPVPVILFSGNFAYSVAEIGADERLIRLVQHIENWQSALAIYRDLIDNRFLSHTTSAGEVTPELVQIGG